MIPRDFKRSSLTAGFFDPVKPSKKLCLEKNPISGSDQEEEITFSLSSIFEKIGVFFALTSGELNLNSLSTLF